MSPQPTLPPVAERFHSNYLVAGETESAARSGKICLWVGFLLTILPALLFFSTIWRSERKFFHALAT